MSDLLKLNNIVQRNGDIKAFPILSNLIEIRLNGKGAWGQVTVAVDNATVKKIENNEAIGMLYVFSREEWEKEKGVKP